MLQNKIYTPITSFNDDHATNAWEECQKFNKGFLYDIFLNLHNLLEWVIHKTLCSRLNFKKLLVLMTGNIGKTSGSELITNTLPVRTDSGKNEKQHNKIVLVLIVSDLLCRKRRIKVCALAFKAK